MKHVTARHPLLTIAWFEFRENIRNKWLAIYGVSFLVFSALMTYAGANAPIQASASLLNLVLLLVPLFSLVFGSLSFSESLPFHEILVALPLERRSIFWGKWIGLGTGLSMSFLVGMGVGSLIQLNAAQQGFSAYLLLLALGVVLTFVFLGLAFLIVNIARRRELVFGWILLTWFTCFVVYDAVVIGIVLVFGEYPLEGPMLTLVFLNPIDLVRVLLLLHMDLAAMMGYSGAVFQKYLGHQMGFLTGGLALLLWTWLPAWLGLKSFEKKDL